MFPQIDGWCVAGFQKEKKKFEELVILVKDVVAFAVLCRAHTN